MSGMLHENKQARCAGSIMNQRIGEQEQHQKRAQQSRVKRQPMKQQGSVRRRIGWLLLCGLLLVSVGCTTGSDPHDSRSLEEGEQPYDNPIGMRMAYSYSDIVLPEHEVGDQNFMTRYIKNKLGIVITYDLEARGDEQYNAMMELAIQSHDLPDVFLVNREQLVSLVERDMIADLTDLYPQYATSLLRSIYDATDGKALREATFDGRLYALPNIGIEADAPMYLWVRQDWMDKLALAPPSTLEDIETIARAFIERDPDGNNVNDTLGIPVDKNLVYHTKTGVYGLDSVFSSFHAFPKSWYRNEEGYVVYGSIQQEAKQALELLARWYREGMIDREFMLRKESGYLLDQNQIGILFAPWWAPYWPLSATIAKDTKAEWKVYAAPRDKDGQFVTRTAPVTDRYLVVRKDYAHPEAALKLLHLLTALERYKVDEDEATFALRSTAQQMGVQLRNYFPFDLLLDDPDAVIKRHDLLLKALAEQVDAAELGPELRELYESVLSERDNPRKDVEAWSMSQAYLLGGEISKQPMAKVESLFFDQTPAFKQYWPALQRLEQDYYLKLLTGELPIEAFDDFVEAWMDNGGRKVMKEASEWAEQQEQQQ